MALPAEILDRPPAEGARTVALALLAEAREQAGRVGARGDREALHDFRVAVRRLRSTLRAWRDVLGPAVRGKDLRRLRRVARATGDARDAEVLLAWLDRSVGDLPPAHRAAAAWLGRRLEERARHPDVSSAVDRLVRTCDRLEPRIRRARPGAAGGGFDRALAARIREHAGDVAGWLARVETSADAPLAHRARIAGKRLRYLLEPLRDTPGAGSRDAVKALKRLQDLLGDLQDARVAAEVIHAARREAEAGPPRAAGHGPGRRLRPGLLALEVSAGRRAASLLARLREEVVPTRGEVALGPALEVAAALEARAARRKRRRPTARRPARA